MKNNREKRSNLVNQKGQTLIVIVIIMIVALSVGLTVSSRFIKTLRDITEADNASRALAAAEAAIERILIIPNETLEGYINFNNCGSDCLLEIDGSSGYKARADVTLSFEGSTSDSYEIKVKDGEVYQIGLNGYSSGSTVDVCWDDTASIYASYIYEQGGLIKAEIYAYNPIGYTGYSNGFSEASPSHGHENCFTVTTSDIPQFLRIRSYNADSLLNIFPSEGQSLPSQGILIISVGRSGNSVKTVQVLKTTGSVPEFFDYVIYQKSLYEPLSNRPN